MPTASPASPTVAREPAREVAGAAGDVEHGVALAEPEQQPRDPHLLGHPRPGHALDHPAEGRAPVALVDRRHEPGDHQVLGRPGRLELALEQVEVAGVVQPSRSRRAPPARLGEQARSRAPAHRPAPRWSRAARVAGVAGELGEPGDLALALDPGGIVRRERRDQALDPVADLKREVGRRRAGERADVLDGDLAAGEPVWPSRSRSSAAGSGLWFGWVGLGLGRPGGGADRRRSGAGRYRCHLRAARRPAAWSATERALGVADQPDVVVDGAGRVVRVAGLQVEQVAVELAGQLLRRRR